MPPSLSMQKVDVSYVPFRRICPSSSSPAGQSKEPWDDRVNLQQWPPPWLPVYSARVPATMVASAMSNADVFAILRGWNERKGVKDEGL